MQSSVTSFGCWSKLLSFKLQAKGKKISTVVLLSDSRIRMEQNGSPTSQHLNKANALVRRASVGVCSVQYCSCVVVVIEFMADLVIMAAVHVVVVAVVVVVVMVAVIHSRCCCTHQSHATSGHPAAPAAMIHELPLLRPQLLAASSVADPTAAAAAADVDPLDPTRLAPQAQTKLILDIDISFSKCGDNFHRVKVCERLLGSLQELDEFLPVSAAIPAAAACSQDPLQRRDHQARNENESAAVPGNPITLIQPPLAVEVPTPVVTVAVLEEQPLRVSIVAEVEIGSGIAERFLRDLGKLVLRLLSTKFTLTFSKPDVSERLLKTALKFNILELAKLVVKIQHSRACETCC